MELDSNREEILPLIHQTPSVRIHFSQLGEDCLIWHRFHSVIGGFYVDVGCHDPMRYSNTYLLYRFRKWHGINIDADERSIAKFQAARPADINLNLGVGLTEAEEEFAIFNDGAVNTFDAAMAQRQAKIFGFLETKKILILPLAHILDEHVPEGTQIDYMNIDCEGLDHQVVMSNNWSKYRPKLLTVELFSLSLEQPFANETTMFLKEHGYKLKSYCHATAFFEDVSA
jgi:hypothetical protein